MSAIDTVGSSLKADTKAGALLEAALLLDNAEKLRNGANTGVAPKSNITITFSSEGGTADIAASLPAEVVIGTNGSIQYVPKDYLGGSYAAFTPDGDVTSSTAMGALVQVAQILANAEKAVTPVEDQSNFVQVAADSEAGTITITATLPYTAVIDATGSVVITPLDYV